MCHHKPIVRAGAGCLLFVAVVALPLVGCSLLDLQRAGWLDEQQVSAIRGRVDTVAAENAKDPDWYEWGPYVAAVLSYPVLRTARRKLLKEVKSD